jgi:hypothetical protein
MEGHQKGIAHMDREYDIFEKVDGNDVWCCSVVGHDAAMAKLGELVAASTSEFTVMHLASKTVIASLQQS